MEVRSHGPPLNRTLRVYQLIEDKCQRRLKTSHMYILKKNFRYSTDKWQRVEEVNEQLRITEKLRETDFRIEHRKTVTEQRYWMTRILYCLLCFKGHSYVSTALNDFHSSWVHSSTKMIDFRNICECSKCEFVFTLPIYLTQPRFM